jgi:hypothetical protein
MVLNGSGFVCDATTSKEMGKWIVCLDMFANVFLICVICELLLVS